MGSSRQMMQSHTALLGSLVNRCLKPDPTVQMSSGERELTEGNVPPPVLWIRFHSLPSITTLNQIFHKLIFTSNPSCWLAQETNKLARTGDKIISK